MSGNAILKGDQILIGPPRIIPTADFGGKEEQTMEQPKIEMREMHTILVFANGSPVGTIINETDEWVVMLTSEMPLNLRHFQTKDEAVNYITSRVVKGEGSE